MAKVLFITQKVDRDDNLLGVYHRWIEELAKRVARVTVICLYRGRVELPANVAVYSLGKESGPSRLKYLKNFYKYIWRLRRDYNTVFVHMNPEYVILAGWLWKLLGKKIILWYAHYLSTWRLRVAAFWADQIVTSTRLAYPLESKKLVVLQQGIDTERFRPQRSTAHDSQLKMLYLGRIAPVKNLDVLLRAVALARQRRPEIYLTVVGEPTPGKPAEFAYRDTIKKLAAELGLGQLVHFRPSVPNLETPAIYNRHDLFVNLTDTGSFDKTTLEAMACEIPVLVSNRAFREIFPAELAARLMFQEKDPEDLAKKIIDWQRLPAEEKSKIAGRLRQLIVEKHGLSGLAEKLAKIL